MTDEERKQAVEWLKGRLITMPGAKKMFAMAVEALEAYVPDTNVGKWIPFKTRPLTEEEKEEYPEWDSMLDCELPDDGQRILVNIKYKSHEAVQMDEFYTDDGCYLDSGYEMGTEATAWMPLPEPWKGEG